MIEHDEIVPFPYPTGIVLSIPSITDVDREFGTCDRSDFGKGSLVPPLQLGVVRWFVKEFKAYDVWTTAES